VQIISDLKSAANGGAWTTGDTIIFATREEGLQRVAAAGGTPSAIARMETGASGSARFPQFLPDGNHFVFWVGVRRGRGGVWVDSLDGSDPPRKLVTADTSAIFAPDVGLRHGYLLYQQGESLMAVRFDSAKVAITGDPFVVVESFLSASNGRLGASASQRGGVLVLNEGAAEGSVCELAVLDRTGRKRDTLSPSGTPAWGHVEVSPDGSRLLGDRDLLDLWTMDLQRKVASRLTITADANASARTGAGPATWSADGRRVFFSVGTGPELYAIPADGSQPRELVASLGAHHLSASFDGKYLAYEAGQVVSRLANREMGLLALETRGKPQVLMREQHAVLNPQFSPDSRWLAFDSDETGRREVYVQSFPAGAGRWQVSTDGGGQMRWRRDGKELYYENDRRMMAVAVKPKGAGLEFGIPTMLFETRIATTSPYNYFAVSPDGQSFYLNLTEQETPPPLTVLVNWMAGLKK
jgi:Tol biopolymer transport system component